MELKPFSFPTDLGNQPGLVAQSPSGEPGPTIVMIHENKGLTDYMRSVIGELAAQGFTVVAPDLMARVQDRGPDATTRAVAMSRHVADIRACLDYTAGDDRTTEVILVGFCFGAEAAMEAALGRQDLAALVAWYGIPPSPESVAKLHSPLLLLLAQDDDRVNRHIPDFLEAMTGAGANFSAMSFPGTKHAFHDRTRPDRYSSEAAARAWEIATDYLARHQA